MFLMQYLPNKLNHERLTTYLLLMLRLMIMITFKLNQVQLSDKLIYDKIASIEFFQKYSENTSLSCITILNRIIMIIIIVTKIKLFQIPHIILPTFFQLIMANNTNNISNLCYHYFPNYNKL